MLGLKIIDQYQDNYALVYDDDSTFVFVKREQKYQDIIEKFELQVNIR